MKYRMIKVVSASGYTEYRVEKKVLFWWDYVYGHWDYEQVLKTLNRLRNGAPEHEVTILHETNKSL